MRVVVHIDLDCFYAQVEAVRLGIDCRTVPFVVSQWGNLIAVNYPARAAGVKRFESLAAAREKCPDLRYSHVATFAVGQSEYKYHENPQKQSFKVSLEPYRDASARIFAILESYDKLGVVLEKGGIDEAFLDVTAVATANGDRMLSECQRELRRQREQEGKPSAGCGDDAAVRDLLLRKISMTSGVVLPCPEIVAKYAVAAGGGVEDYAPEEGLQELAELAAAAAFVSEVRARVRDELIYDCSAGVAHNKLLAKLLSAANKPNKQTVLIPSATLSFIATSKFEKLRGFGGKLGRCVSDGLDNAAGAALLCGEMWCRDASWFTSKLLGDAALGDYVFKRIRGFCDGAVEPRSLSKSLIAQKVFAPASRDVSVLRKWLTVLASELETRWKAFSEQHRVTARHLNVRFGPASDLDPAQLSTADAEDYEDYGNLRHATGAFNHTFPLPVPTTAERMVEIGSRFCNQLLQEKPAVKLLSVTVSITDFKRAREGAERRQQTTLDALFAKSGSSRDKKLPIVVAKEEDPDGRTFVVSSSSDCESDRAAEDRGNNEKWNSRVRDAVLVVAAVPRCGVPGGNRHVADNIVDCDASSEDSDVVYCF